MSDKEINPVAEARRWHQELKLAKKEDWLLIFNYESGIVDCVFKSGAVRCNVGHVNSSGRKIIRLNKKMFLLHRLIWESAYGKIPDDLCIDHIDGNPLNNKLANLRLVTHKQNMENVSKARTDNRVGAKGVKLQGGKYCARITTNHKDIWLGTFKTLEEASMAYAMASNKYHTHNPLAKA